MADSSPDSSQQSITINAPLDDVAAIITDFAAYPEWVGAVKTVEVLEEFEDGYASQVRFVLDAGIVKDDYVLEYGYAEDLSRIEWNLIRGQTQKSQHGSYDLEDNGDGTTTVTVFLTEAEGEGGGEGAATAEAGATGGESASSAMTVDIKDFAFNPPSIEVAAGTTVTWTNSDSAPHTATQDGGGFQSGRLDQGQSFSFTFDTAGTFEYHCEFHPNMHGTVVVK